MSIKQTITLIAAILIANLSFAKEFKVLHNEKWYGISADTPTLIDSQNNLGEPTFLISTRGRYIYSDKPFTATLSNNQIIIDRDDMEIISGGKSLRSAYLVVFHKHLKQSSVDNISHEIFSTPIYDLRGAREYLKVNGNLVKCAEKIIAEGWPRGTLLLGEDWQTIPGSYLPDREYYINMEEQINKLHSLGFKIVLSISPCLSSSGRLYNNGVQKKMLISSNNKPSIIYTNAGYVAVYDATNSQVYDQVQNRLKELIEKFPVDGLYADVSPYYTLFSEEKSIEKQSRRWNEICQNISLPMNLRSVASKRTDIALIPYDYEDIASTKFIKQSISSSFLYTPYSSAIISSTGLPEGDNHKRVYLQNTALCPIFVVPFLPYDITDELTKKECQKIAQIRTSLNTYIEESIKKSVLTGEPLVRPMEYMNPKQGFYDCQDQYMLGDKYIVIPTKQEKDRQTIRLPRGSWFGPNDKKLHGPVVKNISDDHMPLYFRSTK